MGLCPAQGLAGFALQGLVAAAQGLVPAAIAGLTAAAKLPIATAVPKVSTDLRNLFTNVSSIVGLPERPHTPLRVRRIVMFSRVQEERLRCRLNVRPAATGGTSRFKLGTRIA